MITYVYIHKCIHYYILSPSYIYIYIIPVYIISLYNYTLFLPTLFLQYTLFLYIIHDFQSTCTPKQIAGEPAIQTYVHTL